MAQRLVFVKSPIERTSFTPLVIQTGPYGKVIASAQFRIGMRIPQIRRQVNLRCAHQAHGHTDKATAYPKVGMLTGSLATFVVVLQVFGAITSNMICRLDHEVFEKVITSFADAAGDRSRLATAGLFDLWDDTGIRRQQYPPKFATLRQKFKMTDGQ